MITDSEDFMITHGVPSLPGSQDLGRFGIWVLPLENGDKIDFEGYFLGMSSSRKPHHENHDGSSFGSAATWTSMDHRCGACRWFEPRIFVQSDGQRMFGLYKLGATLVPGETNRISFETAASALELILMLAVPRNGKTALTIPGHRVVAQAAGFDSDLEAAYLKWRRSE